MGYPEIKFMEHPVYIHSADPIILLTNSTPKHEEEDANPGLNPEYEVKIQDLRLEHEGISPDFTVNGRFSHLHYNAALLDKLSTLGPVEKLDFLRYQASRLNDPLAWLAALERLLLSRTKNLFELSDDYWRHELGDWSSPLAEVAEELRGSSLLVLKKIPSHLTVEQLAFLFRLLFREEAKVLKGKPDANTRRLLRRAFSSLKAGDIDEEYLRKVFQRDLEEAAEFWTGKLIELALLADPDQEKGLFKKHARVYLQRAK